MKIPNTIWQLKELVSNKIPESLHLDYKASPALSKKKKDELCKDISSFANSDGGMIIYGIEEKNNLPEKLDAGVDVKEINREWIDQILSIHVTPDIENLEIIEIQKNERFSYYVIYIPKSYRGPHQSSDKKYYKRYQFRSSPMEHYEIEDVRNRSKYLPQLVNIDVSTTDNLISIIIENGGNQIAKDVIFKFPDHFKWYRSSMPPALKNGINFFPPGRKLTFALGASFEILSDESGFESSFDICISYFHPQVGYRISENIHVNFNDYMGSLVETNNLANIAKSLKMLSELKGEIGRVNKTLENLNNITSPTGINLSLRTIKNLRHIISGNSEIEPYNLEDYDIHVIKEVLDVDITMAQNIYFYFHHSTNMEKLEDIEGMTEELINKINQNRNIAR